MSFVDPSRTAPAVPLGVIDGSRALPPGFDHPHASEEARHIAERGMILRVQVGSGVHGTSVSGHDDRDEMGICLEPAAFVTGLARVPSGIRGAGSAAELVDNAHRFISRLVADRFLGYLQSQKAAMTGEVGAHTNRPELVSAHGYDTKFAMHALRLGLQGVELLTTGRITLPVPEPGLSYLRSIRRGEIALNEVTEAVAAAEAELTRSRGSTSLPDQPDRGWVDTWLHHSHLDYWQT